LPENRRDPTQAAPFLIIIRRLTPISTDCRAMRAQENILSFLQSAQIYGKPAFRLFLNLR
jgi:hypothetical protein